MWFLETLLSFVTIICIVFAYIGLPILIVLAIYATIIIIKVGKLYIKNNSNPR